MTERDGRDLLLPNIMHLITTLSRGGAENQLLTLCDSLTKGGFSVSVFYLKGNPELKEDFSSMGVSSLKLFTRNGLIQFLKEIRKNRVILHAHLPRAELVAIILGLVFRVKVILSKHNAEPFAPGLPKTISRFLSRFVNHYSSEIIYISEAAKRFSIMNNEIPRDNYSKLHVIHYALPAELINQRKVLDGLNKPQKVLRIGTLSRLEPQKNLSILIEACAGLRNKRIPFVCEIYGRGGLEDYLRNKVMDLNLEQSVKLMGFTNDRFRCISQFDIFVLTSNYEGFGLVLLEAMIVGVPIVSSNSDAAIEVLGEDSRSFFEINNAISLEEKLIELYYNKDLQNEIVKSYVKRLEKFSVDRMFIQISGLYLR
jgi:glycosyltransferase involved in cell wall biosynthesis